MFQDETLNSSVGAREEGQQMKSLITHLKNLQFNVQAIGSRTRILRRVTDDEICILKDSCGLKYEDYTRLDTGSEGSCKAFCR